MLVYRLNEIFEKIDGFFSPLKIHRPIYGQCILSGGRFSPLNRLKYTDPNFLMLLINFIITSMFLCQHCQSSKKALDRLKKCQKGEMFCGDPHWHQDEDNGE